MTKDEAKECFQHYYVPIRRFLIDLALITFIVTNFVVMRNVYVMTMETQELRMDLVTQITQTRTAIQIQGREIASNLSKLNVQQSVLIDRMDNQLTKARTQIHDAGKTAEQSSVTETKELKQALQDNATPAAEVIEKLADTKPTVVVTGPKPEVIVQAPALPPTVVTAPPVEPDPVIEEPKKRSGLWKRLFIKIFHRSRS